MSYNPLKIQGDKLDLINIMSYDADNQYSPITAYQSYQVTLNVGRSTFSAVPSMRILL